MTTPLCKTPTTITTPIVAAVAIASGRFPRQMKPRRWRRLWWWWWPRRQRQQREEVMPQSPSEINSTSSANTISGFPDNDNHSIARHRAFDNRRLPLLPLLALLLLISTSTTTIHRCQAYSDGWTDEYDDGFESSGAQSTNKFDLHSATTAAEATLSVGGYGRARPLNARSARNVIAAYTDEDVNRSQRFNNQRVTNA